MKSCDDWRVLISYAAPSAKAPLEPFAFNPGPLGPEEHN
jgi:hypothetical protein